MTDFRLQSFRHIFVRFRAARAGCRRVPGTHKCAHPRGSHYREIDAERVYHTGIEKTSRKTKMAKSQNDCSKLWQIT